LFDDVIVVPDERCNASTAPPRTSLCNLAPCPPAWSVDSWSEVRRCRVHCVDSDSRIFGGQKKHHHHFICSSKNQTYRKTVNVKQLEPDIKAQ